jgi:RHS repeat-associated protein
VHGLGCDEIFTRIHPSATRYFLADALGSTIALTNPSGTVKSQFKYEPFGRTTVSGDTTTNRYRWTGREDEEMDLYYLRGRYYSQELHRFISRDPVGFAGGDPNLYSYAGNSPTNFADVMGLYGLPTSVGPGGWGDPGGVPYGHGGIGAPGGQAQAGGVPLEVSVIVVTGWNEVSGPFGPFSFGFTAESPVGGVGAVGGLQGFAGAAGKVWNSPNTGIGLIGGGVGLIGGAKYSGIGNNAIQFTSHPMIPTGLALTLGNAILYGSGGEANAGHEQAHTFQGEVLGPGYLPANIIGGLISVGRSGNWHSGNFMEAGPMSNPPRPW